MSIRSGSEYLNSIRDDRRIYVDGERVKDVTKDARFSGAAHTVARLMDIQSTPDLRDVMTYKSPTSGTPVGLSFIEPKSTEDLMRRRGCVTRWMNDTQGMFGRSPDFMNCYIAAFASAETQFAKANPDFGANMRNFYHFCRETDQVMTHVLVNPQVDRSKTVDRQEKELAARIVKETDKGIIVNGARIVSTLAAFANEIVVMPSSYLPSTPEANDFAFGFSVPASTEGLSFIARPTLVPHAASIYDYPLSLRLDESDAVVIMENVLVPWERVFIHRDVEMCNGLYPRTHLSAHTGHQAAIKALAKAEFMLGLALSLSHSTKLDGFLHVQGMIAEIMLSVETVRACIEASERNAVPTGFGTVAPDTMPLWVIRLGFPKMFHRMQEIIQLLGASGLVGAPSIAEFEGPAAELAAEFMQSVNSSAIDRAKLCRLAYDASISSFAGRQQLYERFYTGDPVRLAGLFVNGYRGKDRIVERVNDFLAHLPDAIHKPESGQTARTTATELGEQVV